MTETATPIWLEPARGGYLDLRLAALRAEERDAAYKDRRWLPPPIHHLYGLTYEHSGPEGSTFTLPVTGWLMPPHGVVPGSALFVLADGPLGSVINSSVPPATPTTTSQISLSFISPVTRVGDTLTARAVATHVGRSAALSEVVITDGAGTEVARGGCRMILGAPFPVPDELVAEARGLPPMDPPVYDTPDPYLRPVVGEVLDQEVFDRLDGLTVFQQCISGELPAPPIGHLTGMRPVVAEPGATTWQMPATPWHCSPVEGRLYGGSIALLAGTAIEGTIGTTTKPGTAFATTDLTIYFLRPARPDGRELTANGAVIHRGRTMAMATSEVFDADGRKVAVGIGSAIMLPGRPASVRG